MNWQQIFVDWLIAQLLKGSGGQTPGAQDTVRPQADGQWGVDPATGEPIFTQRQSNMARRPGGGYMQVVVGGETWALGDNERLPFVEFATEPEGVVPLPRRYVLEIPTPKTPVQRFLGSRPILPLIIDERGLLREPYRPVADTGDRITAELGRYYFEGGQAAMSTNIDMDWVWNQSYLPVIPAFDDTVLTYEDFTGAIVQEPLNGGSFGKLLPKTAWTKNPPPMTYAEHYRSNIDLPYMCGVKNGRIYMRIPDIPFWYAGNYSGRRYFGDRPSGSFMGGTPPSQMPIDPNVVEYAFDPDPYKLQMFLPEPGSNGELTQSVVIDISATAASLLQLSKAHERRKVKRHYMDGVVENDGDIWVWRFNAAPGVSRTGTASGQAPRWFDTLEGQILTWDSYGPVSETVQMRGELNQMASPPTAPGNPGSYFYSYSIGLDILHRGGHDQLCSDGWSYWGTFLKTNGARYGYTVMRNSDPDARFIFAGPDPSCKYQAPHPTALTLGFWYPWPFLRQVGGSTGVGVHSAISILAEPGQQMPGGSVGSRMETTAGVEMFCASDAEGNTPWFYSKATSSDPAKFLTEYYKNAYLYEGELGSLPVPGSSGSVATFCGQVIERTKNFCCEVLRIGEYEFMCILIYDDRSVVVTEGSPKRVANGATVGGWRETWRSTIDLSFPAEVLETFIYEPLSYIFGNLLLDTTRMPITSYRFIYPEWPTPSGLLHLFDTVLYTRRRESGDVSYPVPGVPFVVDYGRNVAWQ